ncbi:MAG: HipA N-terminal domain-containing protein [Bacteroidales bacterium]|nr:HipA N-terminal domain-containing protein [Bacteroidales bacterium]
MRKSNVFVSGIQAGIFVETEYCKKYFFEYLPGYTGTPVSLTMPLSQQKYNFETFPPFFDGLLPEGWQLEALLKNNKIDRYDHFSQMLAIGKDTVGNVTVEET